MILTDTHTHLYSEAFDEDRDTMIQRALDAGISRFFIPAIDSSYTERMLSLKEAHPDNIFLMMGLHPTHVKENYLDELAHVKQMLDSHTFFAVGETGIDLYWDRSFLKEQQQAFRQQIWWAKEKDLPIVVHCRESFDEIFDILEQEQDEKLRGIFHCFTGSLGQAHRAIDLGMKLGIGGVVTFKNGGLDKFLHKIDLQHLVLETDAPYLSPTPYRGKRNESAYLTQVLEKLSDIYHIPEEDIATITTENSKEVFGV